MIVIYSYTYYDIDWFTEGSKLDFIGYYQPWATIIQTKNMQMFVIINVKIIGSPPSIH